MPGALLLALGALSLAGVVNARWPRTSIALILPSWILAMVLTELAVHILVLGAIAVAALVALGALGSGVGVAGLILWALAVAVALPPALRSLRTLRTQVDVDSRQETMDLDDAPRIPRWLLAMPLLFPFRPGVKRERGRVFAEVGHLHLKLDIYRPNADPGKPLPAVINVHGGAWVFGSRWEQGLPLLNHLAANGWIGFNIDYRLSPEATMPDHVVDVKRAIAWVREHAAELGVDPDFIAVTGGSAGGHLTALAALSPDDLSFQPGFETADTHVQAAVPFYGIYDLADPVEGHLPALRRIVEKWVVKAKLDQDPEPFRRNSPTHHINAAAPPFFVIHGTGDTLIPIAESRAFVAKLRAASDAVVLSAEIPGGQHSFDSLPTWRSAPLMRAVEQFLAATYATREQHPDATEQAVDEAVTA